MAGLEPTPVALPLAREAPGELWLVRLLRAGAVISGALFLASLALESIAPSLADGLRKVAVSVLILTPVIRLGAAGALLAGRGETRYGVLAAAVLLLLALSLAAGFSA